MTSTRATLGVYELNDVAALRDVFLWAYERSAARYAAVRQSLGEPDPFRLQYRDALRDTIRDIVRAPMARQAARAHLTTVARETIPLRIRTRSSRSSKPSCSGFMRAISRATRCARLNFTLGWKAGSKFEPSHRKPEIGQRAL
jgi:hypothetical protein